MRLAKVVNHHNINHTSSDYKNSSDDSFKIINSSDNTQLYNNHISQVRSSYTQQPNIEIDSNNKSKDLNTSGLEIPTDFPTNGFLYNAIWEKKSTYV